MAIRDEMFGVLAGGFRKRNGNRFGHEVRTLFSINNTLIKIYNDSTGEGPEIWNRQNLSKATIDTSVATVPVQGDTWSPHAENLYGNPGEEDEYHGAAPATVPYYAVPGIGWMWPEGHVCREGIRIAHPYNDNPYVPSQEERITRYPSFCEIRHSEITDGSGYTVKNPITHTNKDPSEWGFGSPNTLGFEWNDVNKRQGAIEFLFMLEKPGDCLAHGSTAPNVLRPKQGLDFARPVHPRYDPPYLC